MTVLSGKKTMMSTNDEVDEDWELEDYMDEEESSDLVSDSGFTFQVDTSELDSCKDKWMNN